MPEKMTGSVSVGKGRSRYANRQVFYLQFPLNGDAMALLKATGVARYSGHPQLGWMVPATNAGAAVVEQFLNETEPTIAWHTNPDAFDAMRRAHAARTARNFKDAELPTFESALPPFLHQRRGFHIIRNSTAWYFDWGMGSGKTKPVIDAINHDDKIKLVLIACPPSVVYVWGAEFTKHSIRGGWNIDGEPPQSARPLGTVLLLGKGSTTKRAQQLNDALAVARRRGEKLAVVLNYQALYQPAMKRCLLSLKKTWDLTVCDEAHQIKAPGGVTSRFMCKLRDRSERRGCLSGTPMPHSPQDIFAQFRFLDPAIFGEYVTRFRHQFPFDGAVMFDTGADGITVRGDYAYTRRCADIKISGRRWIRDCWWFPASLGSVVSLCAAFPDVPVGMSETFKTACDNLNCDAYKRLATIDRKRMEAEFQAKLGELIDKVVTEDVIDLPEITNQFVTVDLGAEAAKAYRDIKKHLVTELEGGTLTAANALARIVRCQQITSGCVPLKPSDNLLSQDVEWTWVDESKRLALQEVIEGLPTAEPVVVFGRFLTDLEATYHVCAELDRDCCTLRGGTNEIGPKWADDPATVGGRATVAAVQIQAGGMGIDLTRACYAIFFSLSYNNGEFRQAIARLHRHGQKRPVHIIHIVARGTIDEQIYEALQAKQDVVTHVLSALRKEK